MYFEGRPFTSILAIEKPSVFRYFHYEYNVVNIKEGYTQKMHSVKKFCSFHMNAEYQCSGLAAEYIIMHYTVHMHSPGLCQMQCNSAQPSLISDFCIDCALRSVHSVLLSALE